MNTYTQLPWEDWAPEDLPKWSSPVTGPTAAFAMNVDHTLRERNAEPERVGKIYVQRVVSPYTKQVVAITLGTTQEEANDNARLITEAVSFYISRGGRLNHEE